MVEFTIIYCQLYLADYFCFCFFFWSLQNINKKQMIEFIIDYFYANN